MDWTSNSIFDTFCLDSVVALSYILVEPSISFNHNLESPYLNIGIKRYRPLNVAASQLCENTSVQEFQEAKFQLQFLCLTDVIGHGVLYKFIENMQLNSLMFSDSQLLNYIASDWYSKWLACANCEAYVLQKFYVTNFSPQFQFLIVILGTWSLL